MTLPKKKSNLVTDLLDMLENHAFKVVETLKSRGWGKIKKLMHMSLGKMLILAGLLKLAQPKPLAPAAGSPAT